ncbi:MAG: YaaC family protein [Intrasporangium sp.]|uniref:YaaC family protein n=1 Tax=Intrasporangium sp. TaxID=1925024 RepID=UPI00264738C4|nr:YaaC family protein [Intrasporangium sp.]MDN5795456.1 YaaC family protein [Intrasporangium sp.]
MSIYTTYADAGEVPPERSWSALRALRSGPPGLAGSEDRRQVFSSALEQAEQLFGAAASVGVATKPLLAFYGLSQAGRAVAAVHAADEWRLRGHGITAGKGDRGKSLAEMTVDPGPRGSFGRLVSVLESSTVPIQTQLGDLWPLLNETARHPLPGSGDDRSLSVSTERTGWATGIPAVRVLEIPARFAEGVEPELSYASGLGRDYAAQADALDHYLSRYPTLSDRTSFTSSGQPIGLQPHDEGTCSVIFRWPDETLTRYSSPDAFLGSIGVRSRASWRVYPALDGGNKPVHPLMVWWAILFRLSMLARYEPEDWATMTNVNISTDAVPIEHLLGTAMSAVPELLFHVLVR